MPQRTRKMSLSRQPSKVNMSRSPTMSQPESKLYNSSKPIKLKTINLSPLPEIGNKVKISLPELPEYTEQLNNVSGVYVKQKTRTSLPPVSNAVPNVYGTVDSMRTSIMSSSVDENKPSLQYRT